MAYYSSSTMCTIALVVLASVVYVNHGLEEAACTAFPGEELLVGGEHVMMQQKKNHANRNIMKEVSTQALPDGEYTIQQTNTMRFLDAGEDAYNDYRAVTRPGQDNDSQKWVITATVDGAYTIQQKVNMKFLDAYEDSYNDYRAAMREAQDNDSQKWLLISLATTTTTTTAVSYISMFTKIGMGDCLKADNTSTSIGWAPCTCESAPCATASGDCPVVDGCADDCISNPDCASFMYYDRHCWLFGGKTARSVYTQTANKNTWYSCYALIAN